MKEREIFLFSYRGFRVMEFTTREPRHKPPIYTLVMEQDFSFFRFLRTPPYQGNCCKRVEGRGDNIDRIITTIKQEINAFCLRYNAYLTVGRREKPCHIPTHGEFDALFLPVVVDMTETL